MSKIQINFPRPGAAGHLVVDGIDLSKHVCRDGLSIDFEQDPPVVTARLWGTSLEVELPEGVMVVREGDES